MEGEEKYVGWVRSMGRAGLFDLWERVKKGEDLSPWSPGRAFEFLILRAFQLEGAQVIWPFRGEWEQVDGAIYVEGLSCLLECKHWREPVDFSPIAKLKVRVDRRPPPVVGLFFSARDFTLPARQELHAHSLRNVLLWGTRDVDLALRNGMRTALGIKWRKAVEEAVMDYELEAEDFR
ncbi:restriction endonuclease [Archangium violaceum]|uniref:restriction endonuclease n=1 Tax=Archangium violaceum TaxID=83451 RepID=UPI00194E5845|nr:restriction endonuclease [Archangium violaceum]QRN96337.1 restriction endonuclease [Archangium violaceum]